MSTLPPEPRRLLLDRLRQEVLARVRAGVPDAAESVLSQHPELASDPDTAADLFAAELVARRERGETPDPGRWLSRHPRWEEALRRRLLTLGLLEPSEASVDTGDKTVPAREGRHQAPQARLAPLPPHERREEIGKGGMGTVYRAVDLALGREVALKALRGTPTGDERRRFLREARAVALLRHPHIAPVLAMGTQLGEDCYTMPLYTGGNLAQLIAQGRLAPETAARILVAIARAVHHAHERGVVHRDLKPSNILLDDDGEPHVADFGLARLQGADDLTRHDAAIGTPSYMAPEQTRGSKVGPAADVWALGVILHECLTGKRPFQGPTGAAIHEAIRTQAPPPVRSLVPSLPRELEAIVLRCLDRPVTSRMPSAGELADELERWLNGEPTHTTAPPRRPLAALRALGLLSVPLLMGAMALVEPARATPPEEPLLARLKRGEAVSLIGPSGLPAYHRWRIAKGRTPLEGDPRHPVTFSAQYPTQLELLPGVPAKKYRLAADIALIQGPAAAFAGVYVMGGERPGVAGPDFSMVFFGMSGDRRPTARPLLAPYYYSRPVPGHDGGSHPRHQEAVGPAKPPPFGAWRHLEVDVAPGQVVARIDGVAAGAWRADALTGDIARWWRGLLATQGQKPKLPPRPPDFHVSGSVGLVVLGEARAQARNVSVTPLP